MHGVSESSVTCQDDPQQMWRGYRVSERCVVQRIGRDCCAAHADGRYLGSLRIVVRQEPSSVVLVEGTWKDRVPSVSPECRRKIKHNSRSRMVLLLMCANNEGP
eukprot:3941925-Rhodomonas_salina.8